MIHVRPEVEWKAGLVLLRTRCSVITGRLLRSSASLPACAAGGFFSQHDSLGSFIRRSFIKAEPTASLDLPASAVKSQESPSNILLPSLFLPVGCRFCNIPTQRPAILIEALVKRHSAVVRVCVCVHVRALSGMSLVSVNHRWRSASC